MATAVRAAAVTRPERSVTAVVVFYRGVDLLERCVASLAASDHRELDLVVVATHPDAGPPPELPAGGRPLRWIAAPDNPGYAAACNRGVEDARGAYHLFLNSDVELDPGCVGGLVARAEGDPAAGALQPKLLDAEERDRFDYGGAAGGLLDPLGYPFARGRLFATVEHDDGAYDADAELFWAAGSTCFVRARAFAEVGGFDPDYFLYMEEIDLAWRLQMAGWRVGLAPAARAWHSGPRRIGRENPQQLFLNHRNSLVLLIKNLSTARLATALPLRLALELVTVLASLATGDRGRAGAVARALTWLARHPRWLAAKRASVAALRRRGAARAEARLYRGSVVWEYFVRGRRRVRDLPRPGVPAP